MSQETTASNYGGMNRREEGQKEAKERFSALRSYILGATFLPLTIFLQALQTLVTAYRYKIPLAKIKVFMGPWVLQDSKGSLSPVAADNLHVNSSEGWEHTEKPRSKDN
ncbi:hypothetical protein F5B19DRAFT_487925 [Rostrohypoxylon terebratum]|nr:hypothetical protein F5B19DRAFT_487925 [Rostrohypoxylon terebratum]